VSFYISFILTDCIIKCYYYVRSMPLLKEDEDIKFKIISSPVLSIDDFNIDSRFLIGAPYMFAASGNSNNSLIFIKCVNTYNMYIYRVGKSSDAQESNR